MYILSTKFSKRSSQLIVLIFCLLLTLASCASGGRGPAENRLFVAVIIPREHPQIAMELLENLRTLRRNVRRVRGRPRIRFRLIPWQKFIRDSAYVAYDAVIYIALYDQIPSDFSSSASNVAGRSLLEFLEAPIFEQYQQAQRFIWILFRETARLDQYRLRFADSPHHSSNTGQKALRKIFNVDLFSFLLNLKELYS